MPIARLLADEELFASQMNGFGHELLLRGISLQGIGDPVIEDGYREIAVPAGAADHLLAACQTFFGLGEADALISEQAVVVPEVFISDMDSTMIAQECIDELADFAGIKPQIAEITERAMQGDLDFASALTERVRLLAGLPETAIRECLATRITAVPGAQVLVATLKSLGCRTILVTGGFHQFADPVADILGFEHVVANRLEISDGRLTGQLIGPIVDSATKRDTLRAAGQGLVTLATGDGANDIPMIEAATYGFAYHAKPKARAAANGWIDRGDLTSVLQLLGIPRNTWVWE